VSVAFYVSVASLTPLTHTYCTAQYSTVHYCTALYCTAQYSLYEVDTCDTPTSHVDLYAHKYSNIWLEGSRYLE
jgi:hypothetical protein